MKRISDREVEMTDAEFIVKEWYDGLMFGGLNQEQALQRIIDSVPENGKVMQVLQDDGFRAYLRD